MIQVFTSYRRAPSSMLASLMKEKLRKHKIDAYVDTYDMPAGHFPDQLRIAIDESEAFVCLLAENTLDSDWVKQEIEYAHKQKKILIPVFQENYIEPTDKPSYVEALLSSNGITVLDKRNLYVDEAMNKLASLIQPVGGALFKTRQIRIEVTLNVPSIDRHRFLLFLSGVALVGINAMTVIAQRAGSVILEIDLPEPASQRIINLLHQEPKLFREYKLKIRILELRRRILISYSSEERNRIYRTTERLKRGLRRKFYAENIFGQDFTTENIQLVTRSHNRLDFSNLTSDNDIVLAIVSQDHTNEIIELIYKLQELDIPVIPLIIDDWDTLLYPLTIPYIDFTKDSTQTIINNLFELLRTIWQRSKL